MKSLRPAAKDLALAGLTVSDFNKRTMTKVIVAVVVSFVASGALLVIGIAPPIGMLAAIFIGAPLGVWILSVKEIETNASQRRGDMDLAIAVFLDLVNVLLAGGAGVETAILAAASSGDGWGFSQIRLSIARSQSARQSYWDGLRELGRSLSVDSLEEVANSVQLAGEHGARVRQSLAAKAHSLRQKNLARIEHEAEQRTEKMGLPIVLLFMGFILLIGYPAFVGTIGAL